MPSICYVDKRFNRASLATINMAVLIIEEFFNQGYDLTLRQLYYQFVSRGMIENKDSEYKRLGSLINDARLAGLIDWDRIVDRTREVRGAYHWTSPADIIESSARAYKIDKWKGQNYSPQVWIEKDALIGVIEGICTTLDVPYFSCRGYVSQSEMWRASERYYKLLDQSQNPVVIHLGDHDPSGVDMTRDIRDRLTLFLNPHRLEVERIALNMDQIEEYNPPPNPAKITDSRAKDYIARYGDDSWELDALNPQIITSLIERSVRKFRDEDLWNKMVKQEKKDKKELKSIADKLNGR